MYCVGGLAVSGLGCPRSPLRPVPFFELGRHSELAERFRRQGHRHRKDTAVSLGPLANGSHCPSSAPRKAPSAESLTSRCWGHVYPVQQTSSETQTQSRPESPNEGEIG